MPFLTNLSDHLDPKTTPDSTSESAGNPQNRSIVKTFQVLSAAAAGMAILLALLPAVGHDQIWCLYVADRMLHGVRLYGPEILESNPPLIMWLLLPVTGLAHFLHLPATALFKAAVVLLEFISALASLNLFRHTRPRPSAIVLWWLAFAFVVIFAVMPARDFGQRDHLLAILCLPYLVAASLDLRPPTPSISLSADFPKPLIRFLIGLAAGLGIALKPHHALIPVAVEGMLLLLWKSKKAKQPLLRPEPWAILLTCLAYLAAVRLLTPAYITDILPILRSTYWAIGPLTPSQLIGQAPQLHVLLVLTFALAFYLVRISPLTQIFLLAGLASTLAYYLQGTGWYYQQLPALSFFSLALALELASLAARLELRAPTWLPAAALALSLLALALTTHFTGYPFTPDRSFPIDNPDPTFFSSLPPGTPIAILTTEVDASVPPITKYHLFWAQRTNNLWILPAILRNEDPQGHTPLRTIPPARLAQLDLDQHRYMVEDLNHWQPPLVLIQRCQDPAVHCQILEDRHDDLLAWFERDPAFRTLWLEHYRPLRSSGEFDAYIRQ